MDKLRFNNFSWPINPETYREEYIREPVYTKTEDGSTVFSGMGPMKRVITGTGAFFGEDAAKNFSDLAAVFKTGEMSELSHSLWGVRLAHFTKLQMTQGPKSDYVAYSFEFTEADATGAIPK